MGLIACPDCGNMVSDRAAACPHCGCPAEAFYETEPQEYDEIYDGGGPGTPVCEVVTDYMKHDPGNDALLKANVHFGCVWDTDK